MLQDGTRRRSFIFPGCLFALAILLLLAALVVMPAQNAGTTSATTETVAAISAGWTRTCAVTTTGGVKCWGAGSTAVVDVPGLGSGVAAVSAGRDHVCVVTTAGGIQCWGGNSRGQLGDGTTTGTATPVDVVALSSGVVSVSAGEYHTCAVTTAGGVKCWGDNQFGQLGDGTTWQRTTPVDVLSQPGGIPVSDITAVTAGGRNSCILSTAGAVKCWGSNGWGQVGDGTSGFGNSRSIPVDVVGLSSGVLSVALGYSHTCAVTTAGAVKCWGDNNAGALGDGTSYDIRTTPVDVVGLESGVAAVAPGNHWYTCAVTTAGAVKCWGSNAYGQLGDGTTTQRTTPVDVVGLGSGVAAVSAGDVHTCALTTTGGVKCWGSNGWGQLGADTTELCYSGEQPCSTTPVDVVGLGPVPTPTPTPAPDADGDGIPDAEDACPDDPEDLDGFEDEDGCPEYLDRKVIFVQGIDSESGEECGLDFRERVRWMVDYLLDNPWVSEIVPSLDRFGDFFYFSYSGLYCEVGGSVDYRQPDYAKTHTCDGVADAATKLQGLVDALISRFPDAKFDIITHSMGGMVAAEWVRAHPDMQSRVNSVITFDSPLRGVPNINIFTSACTAEDPSWWQLLCEDYQPGGTCASPIVPTIADMGASVPFFTIDATQHFLGIEFVPADRTTLLSSESRLHCQFDDGHSSVWENPEIGGGETLVCWTNTIWPPDRRPALLRPDAEAKAIFVACAVTNPADPGACMERLGVTILPEGILSEPSLQGETRIVVTSAAAFGVGDYIRINPGMPNEEDNQITGFASILLASPLQFDHQAGEPIILLQAPPAVGGIVEIQVSGSGSAVDSAAGSSGGSAVPNYIALAGLAAMAVVALTAGAWYARRRWLA